MSILFVASTPTEFLADMAATGLTAVTGADGYDSAYSPNGIRVPTTAANVDHKFDVVLDAQAATVWVHFRVKFGTMSAAADGHLVEIFDLDPAGAGLKSAALDFFDRGLAARSIPTTEASSTTGTRVNMNTDDEVTIDMRVVFNPDPGNIVVDMYIDGVLESTASRANSQDRLGTLFIRFANHDVVGTTSDTDYSEIIVADESTLGWRLATLTPNSAGTYDTSSAGVLANLSDNSLGSSVDFDTENQLFSAVASAYGGDATPTSIRAVIAQSVAQKNDADPAALIQFLRMASTDYEGTAQDLTEAQKTYREVWDNNPQDDSVWTVADLSGIEFGVKASV